jgi:hypothetical protein
MAPNLPALKRANYAIILLHGLLAALNGFIQKFLNRKKDRLEKLYDENQERLSDLV